MTGAGSIWEILGLPPTHDRSAIRRAYAQRLKVTRPEEDGPGFQRLRAAYEAALEMADAAPASQAEICVPRENDPARDEQGPRQTAGAPPADAPARPKAYNPDARALFAPLTLAASKGRSPPKADSPKVADGSKTADGPRMSEALDAAILALLRNIQLEPRVSDEKLHALLQEVLTLAANESLQAQMETETLLVDILCNCSPRADTLIEPCARHFQWNKQAEGLAPDLIVTALMYNRRDALLRAELLSGRNMRAHVFQTLIRPPRRPWVRWVRAHFLPSYSNMQKELMEELHRRRSRLLEEIAPQELHWWSRFHAGPKISRVLLALGRLVVPPAVLALIFLALAGQRWGLLGAVVVPPAYLLLLLAKLYLIDWPRRLLYRPRVGHFWIKAGWLPLLVGAALLAPGHEGVRPLWATVIGLLGCWWAACVTHPAQSAGERVFKALLVHLLLWAWGVGAFIELSRAPWSLPASALAGTSYVALAVLIGMGPLYLAFERLPFRQLLISQGVLLLAGAALVLMLIRPPTDSSLALDFLLVVTFVALSRSALGVTWELHSARTMIGLLLLLVLTARTAQLTLAVTAPFTRMGALVLIGLALLNLLARLWVKLRPEEGT